MEQNNIDTEKPIMAHPLKINHEPLSVIEFNAETIRVCRSVVRRAKRIVTHCFSFQITPSWKDLPQEIIANLKTHKLAVAGAVLMLPRDKAVSRLWTFPSSNPEEINQMTRLRVVKECLGGDKENVLYDYKIVGTDREGCARVAVFLMQRQQIEPYVQALRNAGILITGVTLNSAGLFNWLKFLETLEKKEKNPQNSGIFLLNADDKTYDFQFLMEGQAVFSRSFHVAATQETQDQLSKEIKLSLELCRRQQKTLTLEQSQAGFCLTGSMEKLLGLDIESLSGKNIQAFDPKTATTGLPVSYAAVLGLGLIGSFDGVDLTPRDIKKERSLFKQKRAFKNALFASAVFACLALAASSALTQQKINRLADLRQEMKSLEKPEAALNALLLEHHLTKTFLKNGFLDDVLRVIYEKTPGEITYISLDINDNGSASLSGVAQNTETLINFFSLLKTEHVFKDVKMDFSELKGQQDGHSVKFQIFLARR
jgi:hypothetical protein